MNKTELIKAALSLKKDFRWMHGLLDDTAEMPDSKYVQIVTQMNELRCELFSALAMIGVEIQMTERETAPGDMQAPTRKRDWNMLQKPELKGQESPVPTPIQTENPFANDNGW